MNTTARFEAIPAARSEEPLLIGVIGPPGGGKSLSSLRMAKGIKTVRGGDIVVVDAEGGRSRKYSDLIPFRIVELEGSPRSTDFLDAIRAQLPSKPACIIADSMSDEHESYLEWHDEMVPKMGGNDWAAWAKPKAARKQLISGILKIKVPLIFTFRAREKTKVNGTKKVVVNIGWQPVAPLEIVHTLDLAPATARRRRAGVAVRQGRRGLHHQAARLPQALHRRPRARRGDGRRVRAMGQRLTPAAAGGVGRVVSRSRRPRRQTPTTRARGWPCSTTHSRRRPSAVRRRCGKRGQASQRSISRR
jgi:hypothetical protein